MKHRPLIHLTWTFLIYLMWFSACSVHQAILLVDNGRSEYVIYLPKQPAAIERKAAHELQRYVQQITRVELPLGVEAPSDGVPGIYIGQTEAWKQVDDDREPLQKDGFALKTVKKNLYIVGGKGKGTLYGVYTFLEDVLGCRKYSSRVEKIPRKSVIWVPKINRVQNPVIRYRETYMPGAFDSSYADWHKLHSRRDAQQNWGMWVHTFDDLVPPGVYFAEHPEYFALVNGVRVPDTQLCLSNPEVLEVLVRNLRKKMAVNPKARYWSVSQNDTYGPCECDSCRALEEKYGGHSGLILYFVNRVARRFPNKVISTLAYQYSRAAPAHIRPEKNVNIMLCTIEMNRSQPISEDSRVESRRFRRDIADWSRLTDNILVWDYIVQFRNYISPFPNLRILQPNLRFFVKNHVQMMFEQGSGRSISEFHELRTYLMAKLLWNPGVNMDGLIDDFVHGFYGAAGKYIRKYLDLMHQALTDSPDSLLIFGYPYDGVDSYLRPELITRYEQLFTAAEDAVKDRPEYLERVKQARLPLDFAVLELSMRNVTQELSLFDCSAPTPRVKPGMCRRLEDFVARCKKYGIERLQERGTSPDEYRAKMEAFFRTGMIKHLAYKKPVRVLTRFSGKYPVGGGRALTDGLKSPDDFHCNALGFEGEEMEAVVDLGGLRSIHGIAVDFLQDIRSWVWLPDSVEFFLSENGISFLSVGRIARKADEKREGIFHERFQINCTGRSTRFLRVKTRSRLRCPSWHPGAGGKAWIFADEIVVK